MSINIVTNIVTNVVTLTAAIDNASIGHCGVTEDGTFDISRSKKVVVHQTVFLLSLA